MTDGRAVPGHDGGKTCEAGAGIAEDTPIFILKGMGMSMVNMEQGKK